MSKATLVAWALVLAGSGGMDAAAQGPAVAEPPAAPAAAIAPAESLFSGKQVQVTLGRFVDKEPNAVMLPTMQLHWNVRNKLTATGGAFRKHKSSKEVFVPMDRAVLDRVLAALHADLAGRFEAAGWDAKTRVELGADLPVLKGLKPDAEHGVPTFRVNNTINDQDWALMALPGAEPIDPKSIGNGMAWNRYVKGKAGFNLNVTYSFAAGTVSETKSRQLGTEVESGMWFGARADIIGAASGGWGSIALRPEGMVVDDNVGSLAEIEGSKSGTAENVIRFIGGMGGRDRTGYAMTPDWEKTEAAMLRAGRAFNAEVVTRLTARAH